MYGQPDTFGGGQFWTGTNADVHTNSGIMNYWFYLLSAGGSGTNGIGNTYNVRGIGIEKAAKIVYMAENSYMTSNTDFANARNIMILIANTLFSNDLQLAESVTNAWYAVGVGTQYPPFIFGPDVVCTNSNSTYIVDNLPPGASVSWSASPGITIVSNIGNYVNVRCSGYNDTNFEEWLNATITNNGNTTTVLKNNIVGWIPGVQTASFGQETMQGNAFPTETELTLRPPSNVPLPSSFDKYGTNFMWRTDVPVWTPQFPQGKSSMLFLGDTYCGSFYVTVDFTDSRGYQSTVYQQFDTGCLSYCLSPNPASTEVSVEVLDNAGSSSVAASATEPTYTVQITDMSGTPAYNGKKKGKKFNLSVSSLKNGVYNVTVSDGEKTGQGKLIVKH